MAPSIAKETSVGRYARTRVAGVALDAGVIALIIAGGYVLAKKYNVGSLITQGLTATGQAAGQSLLAPIQGLVTGVNLGTQGVVASAQQANTALFGQITSLTDSFNKFFHPDWYNSDGTYSTKNPNYGKPNPALANPNPNNPTNVSPRASNPPASINPPQANANLPMTSPSNPPSFSTNSRANIITTIKPTTSLPGLNQISVARDARSTTMLRGQPLPKNLQNAINSGIQIQTAVINTAAGGIREVAGSPALIQRLTQNLRSSR